MVRSSMMELSNLSIRSDIDNNVEDTVEALMKSTIASLTIGGTGGTCQAVTWDMVVNESTSDQR